MTRKKRRALLCMLAVPLLALAPRSEESLPASAAEPAAVPEKYVALTFDDGPWPETTEQLLDGLAERGAKATFFLIGEQIAGHEDTVRRMADEGHQVGSHTFTHMDLSRGDPAERLREIAATDETLRALLHALMGVRPLAMYTLKTGKGIRTQVRARVFAARWLRGDVRGAAALVQGREEQA